MKFLKIAIVCYPSIGGSGIVATELGKKLAKLGHQIHFISYEKPFRLTEKDSNIFFHKVPINEYSLFKYPDYTLPLAATISDVHHKHKLDIVHAHYAIPHATAALLAKNICQNCLHDSPKVVTTLHGTDISLLADDPSLKPIIRYSIEKSDAVTAVSKWLADATHAKLCPKKPISVIHNFFDPTPVVKTKQKIRFDLRLPANDFLLIHLSNLRPVKRIPDLLKIVSKLKQEKKIKLVIAAGGDFSPYTELARKLGVESRIKIVRNVKNIGELISACNLGIFTSETESFGLSALECLRYGLPVISTRVGGTPEVIEHEKSGYLFELGDTTSATRFIRELKSNAALYERMSKQAKLSSEQFSGKSVINLYVDLYKKLSSK